MDNNKKFYLTFISNNAGGEMQVQKGAREDAKQSQKSTQ